MFNKNAYKVMLLDSYIAVFEDRQDTSAEHVKSSADAFAASVPRNSVPKPSMRNKNTYKVMLLNSYIAVFENRQDAPVEHGKSSADAFCSFCSEKLSAEAIDDHICRCWRLYV